VIVVAQTPEVVERNHLQVWPRENIRQPLADGFEDADSRKLLDALGKCFFFALGLLLRCRGCLFNQQLGSQSQESVDRHLGHPLGLKLADDASGEVL
jgi:hypothetical protein